MTKVSFFRSETGFSGFQVEEHTGYARRGEDIVCAGISALTLATLLGLQNVVGIECRMVVEDGYVFCLLPPRLSAEKEKNAQLVLKVLEQGLRAMEEEYGSYVKVEEVPYYENKDGSSAFRFQKRRRKY